MSIRNYLQGVRNVANRGRAARRQEKQLRQRRQRFVRLSVERLEDRTLLTISGVPVWTPEGPAPIASNGDLSTTQVVSPKDPGAGGINAVLVDPTNDQHLFVGTQYGGIWETYNAKSATPNWTPLTDQLPSLEISALAYGYQSNNTLYAGLDGRPFNGPTGPTEVGGLLVSTNGGQNWSQEDQSTFAGLRIDALATGPNNVVLAATANNYGTGGQSSGQPGLYLSTNGGQNFAPVQFKNFSGTLLSNVEVTDVVADPGDPGRFYAAVADQGVFRSTNDGQNWTQILYGGTSSVLIELAIPNVPSNTNNPLFVGILSGGQVSVYQSTNPGGNSPSFVEMANTPAPVTGRFSMAADPTNGNLVYLVGSGGGGWLGNAGVSSNQWQSIVGSGANGTQPHVDSRYMTFDDDGNLLELDDGGIYRLVNPRDESLRQWQAVDGNIQVTQFYSVAYDYLSHVIAGGAQDNASSIQISQGNPVWQENSATGDGQITQVDNQTLASSGVAYVYTESYGLGDLAYQTVNESTNAVGPLVYSSLLLNGKPLSDPTAPFTTQYRLNLVTPTHMLIGTQYLYESFDQGNHLTQVTDASGNPLHLNGTVTAMAYGNASNANVAYVGTDSGALYLRTTVGDQGTFQQLSSPLAGQQITGIAMDPTNYNVAYVAGTSDVYFTVNDGATWNRITGNLISQLDSGLNSLEVADINGNPVVLVGGMSGLYKVVEPPQQGPTGGSSIVWTKLDTNLPNAPVYDVHYSPQADVLIVGTFGRGAWALSNASNYLLGNWSLNIHPQQTYDSVRLMIDPYNNNYLDVFQDNFTTTPNYVVPLSGLNGIDVLGYNGDNESLTIDNSNGIIPTTVNFQNFASSGNFSLFVDDHNLTNQDFLSVSGNFVHYASANTSGRVQYQNINNGVKVYGSKGGSSLGVLGTSTPTTFLGFAASSITVGNAGRLQNIDADLTLENFNKNTITVDDSENPNVTGFSVDTTGSGINAEGNISVPNGSRAIISYYYQETKSIILDTGYGGSTVNIDGTGAPMAVVGHAANTINIGSAEDTVQGILGNLTLLDASTLASGNTITIYDYYDTTSHSVAIKNVVIPDSAVPIAPDSDSDVYGQISGLAPAGAVINYENADTKSVYVWDSSALNNNYLIYAISVPTTIQEFFGSESFHVGGATGSVPGVQGIQGQLTLNGGFGGTNYLTLDDSENSSNPDNVVLTPTSVTSNGPGIFGSGTGFFGVGGSLSYNSVTNVTLNASNFGYVFYNFIGQREEEGSTIYVTPQNGMVFNINGNPSFLDPGNTLNVNSPPNTTVTDNPDPPPYTDYGYYTFKNSTTPIVYFAGIQTQNPAGLLVAGTDAGISPDVKVYTAQTGNFLFDLHPFTPSFLGGVRVAVGNVDGSSFPDIITAEGPGRTGDGDSQVQVFSGITGQQIAGPLGLFDPFPGFHGGLYVASADLSGGVHPDLIVAQGAGGHGLVNIYSSQTGALLEQFQPYGPSFTGGVRVAAGPVTSNGHVDVVTGEGPGGPPLVDVFDGPSLLQGKTTPVASFDAFAPSFTGGVYVATGLIHDQGHPPAAIIVGEGAGGEPRVSVFDGTGTQLQSFLAFDPGFHGGVRVATADVNGSGRSAIVAAQGPGIGSLPEVRAFDGVSLQQIDDFFAFPADQRNGMFVAGGGRWGLFHEVSEPGSHPPPVSRPPSPPPAPTPPPTLNELPLLAFFDLLLGGTETVNADGSVTVTDSLFGFPLLVSTFNASGNLESVIWLGFDVTLLFELL